MRPLTLPFILLAVVGCSDADKLPGTWKVASMEANGDAVPEKDFKNVNWKLVINKNQFDYRADALVIQGSFKLVGKEFDAAGASPDGAKFEMVGIYQQKETR